MNEDKFEYQNDGLYEFRGKKFRSNKKTIDQLNYALALNRSEERYIKVEETENEDGGEE